MGRKGIILAAENPPSGKDKIECVESSRIADLKRGCAVIAPACCGILVQDAGREMMRMFLISIRQCSDVQVKTLTDVFIAGQIREPGSVVDIVKVSGLQNADYV